jgi:DNA-binding beta-propeller fold protein YncE
MSRGVPGLRGNLPVSGLLLLGGLVGLAGLVGCEDVPDPGPDPTLGIAEGSQDGIPSFQVDLDWPQLPADWVMASGLGLFVDSRDHVWISHRAELISPEDLEAVEEGPGVPAPLVMELDPRGEVVQGWGTPEDIEEWPPVLHGFFVDHNDFVWTSARDQNQIMKFTRTGDHVLTIGAFDETGGSNDPERLGRPSDIVVDPETNELFVVDGYVNRRVIVFDGETGAYLRHWGAYGDAPDDEYRPAPDASPADPPRQFNLVHGIALSHDGFIYVADRSNSRVQVFRRDGEFVQERVLRPGAGAAFAVEFSHDPGQAFLYVADGTEHKVWILRRADLEVVGELGSEGAEPGQFRRPHNLGVDSEGNLYVAEADPGWRVQRFLFQGWVAPE